MLDVVDDDVVGETETAGGPQSPLALDMASVRQRADDARQALHGEYAHLLARHEHAKPGDGQRLIEIAAALGVNPDTDLRVAQRVASMEKSLAPVAEAKARLAAAEAELAPLQEEFRRVRAELERRELPLRQEIAFLQSGQRDAAVIQADITATRTAHWRLFGLPDPEVAARTKIIAQTIGDPTPAGNVWAIESLMGDPKALDPRDSRFEIRGDPRVIEFAKQIRDSNKPGRYIATTAFAERFTKCRDLIVLVDGRLMDSHLVHRDPLLLPLPGQPDDEPGALWEKYAAAVKKNEAALRRRSMQQ